MVGGSGFDADWIFVLVDVGLGCCGSVGKFVRMVWIR